MVGSILNKQGVSILEVTAILLIVAVILSMAMSNYVGRINHAKYEKTVVELTAIAQASVDFFLSQGSWPAGISQLVPQFIAQTVTSSPFGTNYQIACINNIVTAFVLIPSGIAQRNPQGQLLIINNQGTRDQVEISKTVQDEFTSRLKYDLKYVY